MNEHIEYLNNFINQSSTQHIENVLKDLLKFKNVGLLPKGKSGIYIKKKNRGKFTEAAKRAGKSVQEHAKDVLNDPNATPLQKKRANFARNAKRWKHQEGGVLGKYADKKQFTLDMYSNYFDKLKENKFSDEDAKMLASYLTAQSALESGYGSSNSSNNYNYGGYFTKGEGSDLMKFDSMEDFVDYHYNNLKEKWPNFTFSTSLEDYVNRITSGKYKYTIDDRNIYTKKLKGVLPRVTKYIESKKESEEKPSILKMLPEPFYERPTWINLNLGQ